MTTMLFAAYAFFKTHAHFSECTATATAGPKVWCNENSCVAVCEFMWLLNVTVCFKIGKTLQMAYSTIFVYFLRKLETKFTD